MAQPRTIALDAMGGDHGPEVVIPGAAVSLVRHPALSFLFYGDEARIAPVLAAHPELAKKSRVVHTPLAVSMEDKPSQALRRGKGSSMWLALEAVQKGEAHAAVSAGNTGALMAMAKLILRPMAGIERPGHRRVVADHHGRVHRARRRRQYRRHAPASSLISPSWARPWRERYFISRSRRPPC